MRLSNIMILAHLYKNRLITKEVDSNSGNRFICVSNGIGGFFLESDNFATRFQGLYFNLDGKLFKILEDIEIENTRPIGLLNVFGNIGGRLYKEVNEGFKFITSENAFIYCLSVRKKQTLFLDPRRIFEYPEFGRHFEIISKNTQSIILKYDYTQNANSYTLFIGIKAITGDFLGDIEIFDEWVRREYLYDWHRRSFPDTLYTCKKIAFVSKGFLITAEKNLNQLIKNMEVDKDASFVQTLTLKPINVSVDDISYSFLEQEIKESISRLKVMVGGIPFFYAGLPWFTQFWLRDEAISLDVLLKVLSKKELCDFLKWRLDFVERNTFLPNYFNLDLTFSEAPSYDGTLIFFLKILETFGSRNKIDGNLKELALEIFFKWLKKFIDGNLKGNILSLSSVSAYSQWMDSLKERNGSLIEIEALILALLKQAGRLSKNPKWFKMLRVRQEHILKTFWNGLVLADRANYFTEIRPNIFLAYYFFPDLLSKVDWQRVIDKTLENLWLDWGGLASVARSSLSYQSCHTGENPLSYHNGDSWFFLNAITAFCLLDFKKYIAKALTIYKKLVSDFFWFNGLAFSSELSDAGTFNPNGSPIQLWSASMLLKLASKIEGREIAKS